MCHDIVNNSNSSDFRWHCIDIKLDFSVQYSVDFQGDVSILGGWNVLVTKESLLFSQDGKKESASSRGAVLRRAAHRGESEWLVCFWWKYVKQKTRHFKHKLDTNQTYSTEATDQHWQASFWRNTQQITTQSLQALVPLAIQSVQQAHQIFLKLFQVFTIPL